MTMLGEGTSGGGDIRGRGRIEEGAKSGLLLPLPLCILSFKYSMQRAL